MLAILFYFFLAAVIHHPLAWAEVTDKWALANFQRLCTPDASSCTYIFHIVENSASPATDVLCRFTIAGHDGVPAAKTDFSNVPCEGAPQYHIHGGWSTGKFIVLNVSNIRERQQAWFGYSDGQLSEGKVTGWTESRSHPIGPLLDARDGQGPLWAMRDVTRFIRDSTNELVMFFMIDDGTSPRQQPCTITVQAPPEADIRTYSWANQQCLGSDWYLSWGYMAEKESAVATLVNPERNQRAFFGWDYVNNSDRLADAGPNRAEPCDCGGS